MIPMRGAGRDNQLAEQNRDGVLSEGVRAAITIARTTQVKTRRGLITKMSKAGYSKEEAESAIEYWGLYA